MDTKKPSPKSTRSEVALFLVLLVLGIAPALGDPMAIIAQDWTPEFTDKLLSLLPFYFAGCLVAAVGLVAASLKRFPKHIAPITVAATILALSGALLPLKTFRDEQALQARIAEADMLADSILSMASLSPDGLPGAARAEIRKIALSMFGEEMVGPDFMKPVAKAEVTQ